MILSRLYWNAYLATHLAGQAHYPFKPLEVIRSDQSQNVRKIVSHAYRYVPYYRDAMSKLGLSPEDFREARDLEKLPLLERRQIQEDPEYYLSRARSPHEYLKYRSSGSTGAPLPFYFNPEALFQCAIHGERGHSIIKRLTGKKFGYREITFESPNCSQQKIRKFWQNQTLIPRTMRITRQAISLDTPPEESLAIINDFKPEVIYGHGSYYALMFAWLEKSGAASHQPKAIIYSSDGMPEQTRRLIMEKYQVPVFSWYQTIEAIKIAFECENHIGQHINEDMYVVRIINQKGQTLPDGESGEIVLSNLFNRGTVLLNYRLGDFATKLPTACPCGRSLGMLSFLEGRKDDLIRLPGGKTVHPQAIRPLISKEESIMQYQIIQNTLTSFIIKIVPKKGVDQAQTRNNIRCKFKKVLGDHTEVEVRFVEATDSTSGGKHRIVRSRLKQENIGEL